MVHNLNQKHAPYVGSLIANVTQPKPIDTPFLVNFTPMTGNLPHI